MNVANLQIEGLCLAIAALNRALIDKGLLSRTEIEGALKSAEVTARSDDRFVENLNPPIAMPFVFQFEFCKWQMAVTAQCR